VKEPERIAVDFEKHDLDELQSLAERRGTSAADLIRRAVEQYLRRFRE
jgi:metal-responsive CopG/Arc/MetJ family transcriptional regulator